MSRILDAFKVALFRLGEDGAFALANSIAYSFLLALFPFCIFLGALAGTIGGRPLAVQAVALLFDVVPEAVAKALAPEVEKVMGHTQYGLITFGGALSLFFATGAIESLRAGLNAAYGVREGRSYFFCMSQSLFFVFATAAGVLAVTWGVLVGPALAKAQDWWPVTWLLEHGLLSPSARYTEAFAVALAQLLAYHLWLSAGRRTIWDVLPGAVMSVALWIAAAWVYSWWWTISDYSIYYGGLAQLLTALIFFQVSGLIVIFGAEYNRALAEGRSSG
ncbi:MAG: YihY/virulence factor BrkB family protein [Proteobacteria bacterium]|nr:YihY/virulence factor BrkB family protein [Pseudomonadota bacterium]